MESIWCSLNYINMIVVLNSRIRYGREGISKGVYDAFFCLAAQPIKWGTSGATLLGMDILVKEAYCRQSIGDFSYLILG